jgi:surface antigen
MDPSIKYPQPGMVFVMPLEGEYKKYGHTGFIVSVNDDGTATVKDSNWSKNEIVKVHKIPINKMTGFRLV